MKLFDMDNPQNREVVEKREPTEFGALREILDEHLDIILNVRDETPINDRTCLSKNGRARWWIDRRIASSVNSLHERIRNTIRQMAEDIDAPRCRSVMESIEAENIPATEKLTAGELLSCDRDIHVSYLSLKVTIEACVGLNSWILERIKSAGESLTPAEDQRLAFANAILVYEVVDFCLRAIDDFAVHGLAELKELHERQKKAIADSRSQSRKLRAQARAKQISTQLREKVEADIAHREEALKLLEKNWDAYVQGFDGLQSRLAKFRSRIPELRLIRDNAKAQVDVLSLLGVLRLAQSNVLALEETLELAENFDLAPLTANRVRNLLRS